MTFLGLSYDFLMTLSGLSEVFIQIISELYQDFLITFSWLSHKFLMTFSWLSHDYFIIFSWLTDWLTNWNCLYRFQLSLQSSTVWIGYGWCQFGPFFCQAQGWVSKKLETMFVKPQQKFHEREKQYRAQGLNQLETFLCKFTIKILINIHV